MVRTLPLSGHPVKFQCGTIPGIEPSVREEEWIRSYDRNVCLVHCDCADVVGNDLTAIRDNNNNSNVIAPVEVVPTARGNIIIYSRKYELGDFLKHDYIIYCHIGI